MKNIEFLRVVAVLSIVLLHFFHSRQGGVLSAHLPTIDVYTEFAKNTSNGQKAVDFFFILSGLFFYLGFVHNPMQKFSDFMKKKFIRLWPVMAFVACLAGVFALFGLTKFTLWDNIYALLFLNGTALAKMSGNLGVSWYCSTLMLYFILFFYMLKNFNPKIVWLIVGVGVYLCYGTLLEVNNFHINNSFRGSGGILNPMMLRGWGGIGLGMLIALWYDKYKDTIWAYSPKSIAKVAITAIEFICLYFMINNLMFHKFSHGNDFMFIVVFVVLVTAFVCNKGYISQLLNRDVFAWLSKYSFSIYMTHTLIFVALKNGIWKHNPQLVVENPMANLFLSLGLAILFGVLTYHFVEVKSKKYLTKKMF
jgi:peptidoglycan/LPS O-acetylase OafA/YrhL